MAKKIKKDFDKDQMYSKIMPSIVTLPTAAKVEEKPCQEEECPVGEQEQRFVLRNFVEDIVMDKLGRTIAMLRCCECERCKKDVMAYALNELPPAYMVLPAHQVEADVKQLRKNYEVKVSSALIKAVQKVKAHPNHDEL